MPSASDPYHPLHAHTTLVKFIKGYANYAGLSGASAGLFWHTLGIDVQTCTDSLYHIDSRAAYTALTLLILYWLYHVIGSYFTEQYGVSMVWPIPYWLYVILTIFLVLKVWSQYGIAYTVLTLRDFNYFFASKSMESVWYSLYRIESNTFRSKTIINSTVIKFCSLKDVLKVKISNKK